MIIVLEFSGDKYDPDLMIKCDYEWQNGDRSALSGNIRLIMKSKTRQLRSLEIVDNGYKASNSKRVSLRADGNSGEKEVLIQSVHVGTILPFV